jgi:hypothetical protein
MSNNTGGPAFPGTQYASGIQPSGFSEGMTLRDYFAAEALNTILGQYDFTFFEDDKSEKEDETFALIVAKNAYSMADAMLKARG